MIDYKNYFIFEILKEKILKTFSDRPSVFFYDRRTKSVFRKILVAPKPLTKYWFTDTTMQRVKLMDLSKCYPTKLGYLFEKHGPEIGMVFCNDDKLAFVYAISATNIQLIITSGTKKAFKLRVNDFGQRDYADFNKAMVGACVISYDNNKPEFLINNLLSIINNGKTPDLIKRGLFSKRNPDSRKALFRLIKDIDIREKKGRDYPITYNEFPELFNTYEDQKIKEAKIWTAIKMFIFLKTAKVIDQTFLSENDNYGIASKLSGNDSTGIIVVDSTWDSSIHVINPFAVSGHFRQQPKKNIKKEWYKELIYIDSYMKNGYHRNAKKDNQG